MAGREDDAQTAWRQFLELEPSGDRADHVKLGCAVLAIQPLSPKLVGLGCPVISPDGRHLAFARLRAGLFRIPLSQPDAPWQLITKCPEGWNQRFLAWSPDGTRLAYTDYRVRPETEYRIKIVSALPGGRPESVDLQRQGQVSMPVWSPNGGELLHADVTVSMLCPLDLATGEYSRFKLVDSHGKELWTGQSAYMPNGTDIIAQVTGKADGKLRRTCCRASLATRTITAELFVHGDPRFMNQVVREDGLAMAGNSTGTPTTIDVARTTTPSRLLRLCEAYQTKVSWHPDGNSLVAAVVRGNATRLATIQLGGLNPRPVRVSTQRKDGGLDVAVTSQTDKAQQMSLRWEAFDENSVRVGTPGESEAPLGLKPGEKVDWSVKLPAEGREKVRTVKVRVLNQDGVGAVKLVDW